jgi:hypothetical protein
VEIPVVVVQGSFKRGVPCDSEALLVLSIEMLLSPFEIEGGEWKQLKVLVSTPFEPMVDRLATLAAEDFSTRFILRSTMTSSSLGFEKRG